MRQLADIVKRLIDASMSKNQAGLASYLEISPSKITDAVRRGSIPQAWLYKIAYRTGYNVEWLKTGRGEKMQAIYVAEPRVPLYLAKFPAGPMGSVIEPEVCDDYFSLSPKGKPRFAVPVRGDSMTPDFRDGDIIIVERTSQASAGDFVLAKCDAEEEGTFKKLVKKRDGYVLQPLNGEFSEIPLDQKHRIVGKVVWLVRKV